MKLELTNDQALILFELLARLDEAEGIRYVHEAERQVVWALHGQLEKNLVEPLSPDYRSLVEMARSRISD